jgi:tetratricopeptide (TPR) repeat protein
MPDTIRCPGCGQENPADSARCGRCNHPLRPAAAAPGPPAAEEPVFVLRRPLRRPRPRPMPQGSLGLWALAGAAVVATIVYYVYTDLHRRAVVPIEGASAVQQRAADSLRAVLERDSTDLEATIAYGNILYDTANWAQAARYYARALARDSSRAQVLVDLGVCRYNQGDAAGAVPLFQAALRRESGHVAALFNLGFVHERAGDDAAALRYFHQALAAGATGAVERTIVQHLQDIQQRTGRPAPRFGPGGAPADGAPGPASGPARRSKGRT